MNVHISNIIHSIGSQFDRTFDVSESTMREWCGLTRLSKKQFFDDCAEYVALEFHSGRMSFELCDFIVNALHWPLVKTVSDGHDVEWSDKLWEVYLAFDAGEFYPDDSKVDPVDRFTRPLIDKFVERIS